MDCPECKKPQKEDDFWMEKEGICFWCDHKKKEALQRARTSEMAKRDGYCHHETAIYCPHCGEMIEDWEIHESEENYECPECEKKFDIEVEYTAYYSTEKSNQEDKGD